MKSVKFMSIPPMTILQIHWKQDVFSIFLSTSWWCQIEFWNLYIQYQQHVSNLKVIKYETMYFATIASLQIITGFMLCTLYHLQCLTSSSYSANYGEVSIQPSSNLKYTSAPFPILENRASNALCHTYVNFFESFRSALFQGGTIQIFI